MAPAAVSAEQAVRARSLQVTFRDLVGRRFNGYGLHDALRRSGRRSEMLVIHRASDDPDVHDYGRLGAVLERGLYGAERVSGLQGLLSPFAATLPLRRCFRSANVVHWHLVYPHFLGIPGMAAAARWKPTVWTLHDPWATTGHCVHPLECERWRHGCGRCPDLDRNFSVWIDTTAMIWRAKRAAWRHAPITLVVGTRWMKERVERSPLLQGMPCHVIPFGLDLSVWTPAERRASRERLGIAPQAHVIAFRMPEGPRLREAKGIPALLDALRRLETRGPVTLLSFEDRGPLASLGDRFQVVEPGWVNDESAMAAMMSAADVFVMPSLAESFGFMALEAMACGVPVVVTEGTAMVDTVRPPRAGLAVPPRDGEALARAIDTLLADPARRASMGAEGRRIVEADYAQEAYVRRHAELYDALAGAAARPAGGAA